MGRILINPARVAGLTSKSFEIGNAMKGPPKAVGKTMQSPPKSIGRAMQSDPKTTISGAHAGTIRSIGAVKVQVPKQR